MRRLALWCLLCAACVRPNGTAAYDLDLAGPCANPYLPLALGNHWEYDLSSKRGTPLGSVTLDVIAVDSKNGRATLRSVEHHPGQAGTPDFITLACAKRGVAAVPHVSNLAASPDSPVALPAPADVESSDHHWTARSFQQVITREGTLRADVTADGRRAPLTKVKVPAGEYSAFELDQHIQIALSNNQQRSADTQLFVATNVGVVRATGPQRVISLRSFQPRLPVSGPQAPPLVTPRAQPLVAPKGCSCDPCSDQWGGNKNCKQCNWCDCFPTACGCPGQPACDQTGPGVPPPTPVCPSDCVAPGTPGMNAESCPYHARFWASFVPEELCRDVYWDSVIGGILSGLGIEDANDFCGRSTLMGDHEWEAVSEGEAVGTVAGTPAGCGNPPQGCGDQSVVCGASVRSGDDLCYTHHDRDFEFDLAVDQNSPAMQYIAPLNMIPNTHLIGRDIGVEWEYSFMFPPHTDIPQTDLPISVPVTVQGQAVSLSVPWPGDAMAVHGAVISDCGHPCGDGNHARTEFHPPTALAWLHPSGKPGHYRLNWRASSHATFPRNHPTLYHGTLHSSLPLPDRAALLGSRPGAKQLGPLRLESQTTCDYLFTDWDFNDLDSCKHAVSVAPYLCDALLDATAIFGVLVTLGVVGGITGIAADLDIVALGFAAFFDLGDPGSFINACRGRPSALLEYHDGVCGRWPESFNLQIAPGSDGQSVSVALDSKVNAPDDRPHLFGGHVDLCVPICPGGPRYYCGPSENDCGFCTGSYCDQPNVACGAPVPNCGGASCQRGACANGGECVNGRCQGCKCNGACGVPNGCGGTCQCTDGSVCVQGHCFHACRNGEVMCGDGNCRPKGGDCQ